ncbi:MAG: hypothetical protein FJ276_31215 [Planctomycetes bacterium]|nr:hypothetical protein [Planctomycetota bacterium]
MRRNLWVVEADPATKKVDVHPLEVVAARNLDAVVRGAEAPPVFLQVYEGKPEASVAKGLLQPVISGSAPAPGATVGEKEGGR